VTPLTEEQLPLSTEAAKTQLVGNGHGVFYRLDDQRSILLTTWDRLHAFLEHLQRLSNEHCAPEASDGC
jgi:hypothetical protein